MDERAIIAGQLRAIASELEEDLAAEEERIREDFLEHYKKKFMNAIRMDPKYRHQNPEKLWERLKEDMKVDVKRVRA